MILLHNVGICNKVLGRDSFYFSQISLSQYLILKTFEEFYARLLCKQIFVFTLCWGGQFISFRLKNN